MFFSREIHAKKGGNGEVMSGSGDEATDENSQSGEVAAEGDDELNAQALAESGYRDHYRKYKCHRCKVAFTKQMYLTAHNKTLQHRKGEKSNYPMEKYLDPNRPHKCEICKESFTQKNILLVHYNSVSHLHKKKKFLNQVWNWCRNSLRFSHSDYPVSAVRNVTFANCILDGNTKWSTPFGM